MTLFGPDGGDYANRYRFIEPTEPERVVIDHVSGHWFRLTLELQVAAGGTCVMWRQTFGTREERDQFAGSCVRANEQNLDLIEELLAGPKG